MPKRRYADLHVKVIDDGSHPELLIRMARHLGFSLIALSSDDPSKLKDLEVAKEIGRNFGVDVALRLDLKASSPNELKTYLRKYRRRVEIIGVYCDNVAVARTAARDRRVDITFYDPGDVLSILDEGQISLLAESGHYVEVNFTDLLHIGFDKQAKVLWDYSLMLKKIVKKGIPVIISSGASNIIDMRAPRELSALAFLLLNEDREGLARDMVSTIPMRLVQMNREKLSPSFVQPGVKVVNEW
ncbi:MAG: RNase P subunit p30 family protein [Candidatus Nezhaarchaeota archaeon]|nr:RNase P subunit p30 family protein [Candidatus Nezhaarchaeota archaeon]